MKTLDVIGVRFAQAGRIYWFSPKGIHFDAGDRVIVETARGIECGTVAKGNHEVDENEIVKPLRQIIRKATKRDIETVEENKAKEADARKIFVRKVKEHNLDMKLASVEYTFDNAKIVFYYTAPTRVDFRELVKDLAGVFRTRIELRQIGVRDGAKMLGGLGPCGRPYCCREFLNDFQPVSLKMAKEQGMSLNIAKISGACGRLLCCIKYEQETYDYLYSITPKVGAIVDTKSGRGTVTDVNVLTGKITVQLDKSKTAAPTIFMRDDIKIIRDGKIELSRDEQAQLKGVEGD